MSSFFGLEIASQGAAGMTLALVLAVVLGGLIGLERELHGHPAGLRTHILVCVGSTVITLVSVWSANLAANVVDPTRISAQIVSGIGFLGAGAIVREGATVRGLTTAASLWATAGIGLALGTAPKLAELGLLATAIVLFTLWILNRVEDWIELRIHRAQSLQVIMQDRPGVPGAVLARIANHEVEVKSIEYEREPVQRRRQMLMRVRLPREFDRDRFLADMGEEPDVASVDLR